jgi:hypothetical protein
MNKNLKLDNVIPDTTSLADKEGYAVGSNGVLTTSAGQWAFGVVFTGLPADQASVVVTGGRCSAMCNGVAGAIAVDDALIAGSDGIFIKGTVGTHDIRAHAKEAVTSRAFADIELISV